MTDRISIDYLIQACAEHAGVEPEVIAHDRIPPMTAPYRQVICYLANKEYRHHDEVSPWLNTGDDEVGDAVEIVQRHVEDGHVAAIYMTDVGVQVMYVKRPDYADCPDGLSYVPIDRWADQIRRSAAEMQAADDEAERRMVEESERRHEQDGTF